MASAERHGRGQAWEARRAEKGKNKAKAEAAKGRGKGEVAGKGKRKVEHWGHTQWRDNAAEQTDTAQQSGEGKASGGSSDRWSERDWAEYHWMRR